MPSEGVAAFPYLVSSGPFFVDWHHDVARLHCDWCRQTCAPVRTEARLALSKKCVAKHLSLNKHTSIVETLGWGSASCTSPVLVQTSRTACDTMGSTWPHHLTEHRIRRVTGSNWPLKFTKSSKRYLQTFKELRERCLHLLHPYNSIYQCDPAGEHRWLLTAVSV